MSLQWNLADLFEATADAVPDRTALVCGDRRFTYRELDERATRLANHLSAQGVIVCITNSRLCCSMFEKVARDRSPIMCGGTRKSLAMSVI